MQIKEIISESPLKVVLRHIKDLDDLERSIRKSPAGIDKDTEQKINDKRKQLMKKKQELGEEGYDKQRDKDAISGKPRKTSVGGGKKPKGYSKDKAEKAAIDNVKKALTKESDYVSESKMTFKDMMKQREFYHTFKQYVSGNANIDQVAELVRGYVDKETFADEVFKQGVRMGGAKGSRIKDLANYIRKDSNVLDLPGKAFKKIKKMFTKEEATAGATSAGSIATVANPVIAKHKPKKRGRYGAPQAPQKKKADGTATNALDVGNNLMGGKAIKR